MYLTQKRLGRPHKTYPKIDRGTMELQQKRRMLLEKGVVQDLTLAESLLGVLYAYGMISRPLYEAGRFFGEIGYQYKSCLGHCFSLRVSLLTHIGGGSSNGGSGNVYPSAQDEKRTQAWRNALKALKEAGPDPYEVVLRVVFNDCDLYTEAPPLSSRNEIGALRQGLKSLDKYFKGEIMQDT